MLSLIGVIPKNTMIIVVIVFLFDQLDIIAVVIVRIVLYHDNFNTLKILFILFVFTIYWFFQLDSSIRNLKLSGHVGFDSLPDQLVNKSVQNGFVFNILCIGMIYFYIYKGTKIYLFVLILINYIINYKINKFL